MDINIGAIAKIIDHHYGEPKGFENPSDRSKREAEAEAKAATILRYLKRRGWKEPT